MKTACVPRSSHILTCRPVGGLSQPEAPHLSPTPSRSFLHKKNSEGSCQMGSCHFPLQKALRLLHFKTEMPLITFMTSSSSTVPNSSTRDSLPSSVHRASSPCHLEAFALAVASGWDNSPPRASPLHGLLLHVTQLLFRHLLLSLASPHPNPSTGSKTITITPFSPCFLVIIFHVMDIIFLLFIFCLPTRIQAPQRWGLLFMLCYNPNTEDCAWHRIGNQIAVESMGSKYRYRN